MSVIKERGSPVVARFLAFHGWVFLLVFLLLGAFMG